MTFTSATAPAFESENNWPSRSTRPVPAHCVARRQMSRKSERKMSGEKGRRLGTGQEASGAASGGTSAGRAAQAPGPPPRASPWPATNQPVYDLRRLNIIFRRVINPFWNVPRAAKCKKESTRTKSFREAPRENRNLLIGSGRKTIDLAIFIYLFRQITGFAFFPPFSPN